MAHKLSRTPIRPEADHEFSADRVAVMVNTAAQFTGRRLLLIGSGAVAAMHLPFWLNWVGVNYPDVETQVVLTPSAERFVTLESLTLLTGREAVRDRWPDRAEVGALHVRLLEWADTALVYPACLNFVSRLALGLADSPALLALQCAAAIPIGVAPSLPPGASDNPVLAGHLRTLADRPNVVVAPTVPAASLTSGRPDAAGAAAIWTVLELIERRRHELLEAAPAAA